MFQIEELIQPEATTRVPGLGADMMSRREGHVARHPGLRTRRVRIAATMALGLAILSSGTAAAFTGARGETGTVFVQSRNTTTHTMSAVAYITSETYAQRNTIPQGVAVRWWICSSAANKCNYFATDTAIVNQRTAGFGTGGDSATFVQTTRPITYPGSGYYWFVVQYGWEYTDGYHWSPFESTLWYRL